MHLKRFLFFWGILICKKTPDGIKFRYIRKSKINPMINKKLALLSLWKSELEELAENLDIQNIKKSGNRDIFATKISQGITLDILNHTMSKLISKREPKNDWSYK
jgi:hypothetical protein